MFKIPRYISEDIDDGPQFEFVARLMKDSDQFAEKVIYLASHPEAVSRDAVELVGVSISERYSYPVMETALNSFGRIWSFRGTPERRQLEDQFRQAQKMEAIGQ